MVIDELPRDLFKLAISDRFVWQLMSEAGISHPYSNDRIENFYSLLKRELIYQRDCESIADVQIAVG